MRCVLAVLLAVLTLPAAAVDTDVYLFWRIGCPHCEREIEFLDRLVAAKPGVRLHKLEVSRNRANANAMIEIADRLGVEAGSVPLTVIGDRDLAQRRNFVAALAGIVLLAFAVNVVEFLCSAGIPAVFTQVLALSSLSRWEYLAYLSLYVGVFMLDDLVVLATALKTLEVSGLTTRYARWSNAIGGFSLLAIGALLILRPEWLAFG
jgi:thiol-disulfide isomerase/thioredoxin